MMDLDWTTWPTEQITHLASLCKNLQSSRADQSLPQLKSSTLVVIVSADRQYKNQDDNSNNYEDGGDINTVFYIESFHVTKNCNKMHFSQTILSFFIFKSYTKLIWNSDSRMIDFIVKCHEGLHYKIKIFSFHLIFSKQLLQCSQKLYENVRTVQSKFCETGLSHYILNKWGKKRDADST